MADAEKTISESSLSKLTGMPVDRLRRLARAGVIPSPKAGEYSLARSLQGLFVYFLAKEAQSDSLPTYDSIALASGATGIPVARLKLAKKGGCPGFKDSRVKLDAVLKWLFAQPDGKTATNWADLYREYEAKSAKLKLEKMRGRLIERAQAEETATRISGMFVSTLDRVFLSELPPLLKGRSEVDIRKILQTSIDRIRADLIRDVEAIKTAPTPEE